MVAARDSRELFYLDVASFDTMGVAFSAVGDEDRPLCVMDIASSPCGRYLLLATDANQALVCETRGASPLAVLGGIENDGFSTPRCVWDAAGGDRVYCTSQDLSIAVWQLPVPQSMRAEAPLLLQPIERLRGGHTACIRDICWRSSDDERAAGLVSCSYDSSVIVWE